ncbi:MAG: mannose-1-phosphate guanylyltransferase [Anaerolineae bacterium]|jgi:mannose-1-phosphate guanylyltransferase
MPSRSTKTCADVHITILAGGSGTRLWPLSRTSSPKQLLDLFGDGSLLRNTIERVLPLVPWERIYILTGPDHAPLIWAHLPELPNGNLFVEPSPRGTAPCLGLAAMRLRTTHPGSDVMVSLHADHVIADADAFRRGLQAAIATARQGHLVTVGIVPRQPETGFGYIERGAQIDPPTDPPAFAVARFVEKPPLEVAREFVAAGSYYWNAGYFAWTLDAILEAFHRHLPATHQALEAIVSSPTEDTDAITEAWNGIAPVTIDVGIMEQATDVAVVPCDMGWNDVGSWAAVYDMQARDEDATAAMACSELVTIDSGGNLVHAGGKLVATIGIHDLVIVDTPNALLVMPRDRAQQVSELVKLLRARGHQEQL